MVFMTLDAGQCRLPVWRTVSCSAISAASSSCIRAGCCGKTGEGRASEVRGSCSTLASGGEGSGGLCKRLCRGTSSRNGCVGCVGNDLTGCEVKLAIESPRLGGGTTSLMHDSYRCRFAAGGHQEFPHATQG